MVTSSSQIDNPETVALVLHPTHDVLVVYALAVGKFVNRSLLRP
jgi:hypothetical protein